MTPTTRLLRLLIGFAVLVASLTIGFGILTPRLQHWGATPSEVSDSLPGDDILASPQTEWTQAATINAPPSEVWPWLAQIGDTHAGFYSFTFIEDRVGRLTGGSTYQVDYTNANEIHPEWQNPQPGEQIIQDTLQWQAFEPGRWLLANSVNPKVMGWTWVWRIEPTADGSSTRLVNRLRLQVPGARDSALVDFFIGHGAYLMNQRMMNGIEARAEGWREPRFQEAAEFLVWFLAFAAAVFGAVRFVARRSWIAPLALAVASVAVILVVTFVQPTMSVRCVMLAVLAAGVWATVRSQSEHPFAVLSADLSELRRREAVHSAAR